MVDRRGVLAGAFCAVAGTMLALPSQTAIARGAEPAASMPEVPEAFRKRAAELGYDLNQLWITFHRLQSSYESRDAPALWAIAAAPLLLIDENKRIEIGSLNMLETMKRSVFSDKVRNVVIKSQFPSLFLNGEGAMLGDGEVWIKDICHDVACARSTFAIGTIDLFKE